MKKTEIAARVFAELSSLALKDIEAGPLVVPLADLCGLMLVPWFCDGSIQWALRLTSPGAKLKKTALQKTGAASVTISESGAMLIGIPGDGIRPYLSSTFLPLCAALPGVARPGTTLEFGAANLGVVKLDEGTFQADAVSRHGNQHYLGTLDNAGNWSIARSSLPLSAATLERALHCGRMAARGGPWKVEDASEAFQVLMRWMENRQANINPMAVKHFIKFKGSALEDTGLGQDYLCGLALGFFRHRLAGSCFTWNPPDPAYANLPDLNLPPGQLSREEVARAVIG